MQRSTQRMWQDVGWWLGAAVMGWALAMAVTVGLLYGIGWRPTWQ